MFLPLRDDNPLKVIPFQIVTAGLIAACIGVFVWQFSLGQGAANQAVMAYGAIPSVIFGLRDLHPDLALVPPALTVLTSLFLHGDILHLGGNMLYLWVFGDNIEDAMGHMRFIVFYLLCGVAATLAHGLSDPASPAPLIGASGAISGVLAAYLVLHPRVKVLVLAFYRIPIRLPAYIVLGGWIALQGFNAWFDGAMPGEGGTAWWAHIGGFLAGLLLIVPMRRRGVPLFDRGRY